jgi:hypothetical protein
MHSRAFLDPNPQCLDLWNAPGMQRNTLGMYLIQWNSVEFNGIQLNSPNDLLFLFCWLAKLLTSISKQFQLSTIAWWQLKLSSNCMTTIQIVKHCTMTIKTVSIWSYDDSLTCQFLYDSNQNYRPFIYTVVKVQICSPLLFYPKMYRETSPRWTAL